MVPKEQQQQQHKYIYILLAMNAKRNGEWEWHGRLDIHYVAGAVCHCDACLLFGWYFSRIPIIPKQILSYFLSVVVGFAFHIIDNISIDKCASTISTILWHAKFTNVNVLNLYLFLYWLCMGIGISGFYFYLFHSLTHSHSCSLSFLFNTLFFLQTHTHTQIRSNTHKNNIEILSQ